MKKFLAGLLLLLVAINVDAKELKVLMIGNSFARSVLNFLPKLVQHEKEHKLLIAELHIGGCTLERHIKELEKSQKDPKYKPYYTSYPKKRKVSLPDLIGLEKWDIITIQQGSRQSWDQSKTQPFADTLIAYVRKHAPQAEIVIQQTWSYRISDPRIGGGKPIWGFDQTGMYDKLTQNYVSLANKYQFRIIPVGKAVQLFRQNTPVKYVAPNPNELKSYVHPDLPRQAGDVVGSSRWVRDLKTGKQVLKNDNIHLNKAGDYLQACVWYGFLFNVDPQKITYAPENIDITQIMLLRQCAKNALEQKL